MRSPAFRTLFCARRASEILSRGLVLVAIVGAAACSPKIGDECSISTDCSSTGDRLCDSTQPDGYCTIFNCEPGSCPEDSVCIGFRVGLASTCSDTQVEPRFERLFCMASCTGDGDCRAGYDCVDMAVENNDHGALVLESGPANSRVCAVPASPISGNADLANDVCTGDSAEDEGS